MKWKDAEFFDYADGDVMFMDDNDDGDDTVLIIEVSKKPISQNH